MQMQDSGDLPGREGVGGEGGDWLGNVRSVKFRHGRPQQWSLFGFSTVVWQEEEWGWSLFGFSTVVWQEEEWGRRAGKAPTHPLRDKPQGYP